MENLERQLEEIEVLEAVYPDELKVDASIIETAKQHLQNHSDGTSYADDTLPNISFSIRLARLASFEHHSGKLKHTNPSITIEFPPEYPECLPPLVTCWVAPLVAFSSACSDVT